MLYESFQDYYRFLTGFEPTVLRPVKVRYTPRHEPGGAGERLRFVPFALRAPKAKSVELIGDFNGWKAGTLKLSREKGQDWELLLPLPPGRYHYLFVVDGEPAVDPKNTEVEKAGERKASVKEVR